MPKLALIPPAPIQKSPDDLLDSRDVAKMLSVDISWVKNHCTVVEPFIPHIRLGGGRYATRRFKREDILKFIEERAVRFPTKFSPK
jgi:hypothetical protein